MSAKRRRELEEDTDHNTSKRQRKAATPDTQKFLFSKTRNRSLLTSAPPKLNSRNESAYFDRAIEPESPESSPTAVTQRPSSQERTRPQQQPETPTRTASQGGLLGSVRKIFGWVRGGSSQGAAANQEQPQQSNIGDRDPDTAAAEEDDVSDQGSPSPTPRRITYEPESPTPEPETVDSRIFTREHFKRRRTANTIGGREQISSMEHPVFQPTQILGSNKRKLASVDGQVPGPRRGGYGIDDSYLDVENDVEGIEESSATEGQPSTPTNKPPPQTPLRSALRQTLNATGRSAKSVRINSVPTSAKAVYGQYGPAGDYRGSTFADMSSQHTDSPSDLPWDVRAMHSPDTMRNTYNNTPHRYDPTVTDPTNETWRPSPANPRPGNFVLPDFEDDEDDGDETSEVTLDQVQGKVPSQPPSTPRMSHAELPQTSAFDQSGFTGHSDSIMVNDTQEIRLNKARSDAQKYKPAKSSRLSLSEQARSRSSSPPGSDSEFRESPIEVSTPEPVGHRTITSPQDTTMQTASPLQPLGREDLDNTIVDEDGMTEYEREHQYDAWAAEIFKNVPSQTYIEAGVVSSYVDNLVQKTWTDRDTRESIEFWDREFEEGLKAAREAREQGRELIWVTDPDEIIELEQSVY
ncbi:hypothetical protein G647_02544 [Cladophialophora carrionii CBS 160.54]|uniref:Uncharacterized protein n=1 Tax=Cladophialophora carrionii CBS 160.54 TaxID=1279043 RepID=V9DFX4_9EURO|nr:uncharacterized protein G647_02544 [Cladophialophora carrionii CBS 160.54]ETI25770.1 hypothetical protein G647_02544 [Cladophialophora carrionii CBS 160.54]